MPPKKKPPSQAGKFKPLKRPQAAKKSTSTATATNAPPTVTASSSSARGRSKSPPKQQSNKLSTGRGRGRGSGRGRGGGLGRGRGGRGGRFVIPTGTAFFTGEAAKRSDGGVAAAKGGDSNQIINVPQAQEVVLVAGTDGAVYMPGGGSNKKGKSKRSSSKKDDGEEEEIVIADLMDVDDEDIDIGKKKKKSVLDGPSTSQRKEGSMFDDTDQNVEDSEMVDHSGLANQYLYDSDSSAEEERANRRGDNNGGGLRPVQLPFAIDPNQQTMYDCQEDSEEEKKSDTDNTAAVSSFTSKLSDPPLQSPFLDLETVSDELKQMESDSWYLMKFPTRLPHVETSSSSRKKVAAIKKEINDVSNNKPDMVGSSSIDINMAGEVGSLSTAQSALGYDDTLKDLPSGRYGRIVVRKSGKTELIIGGEGEEPEVRLLIHEGLQCGFRQEAISIDPEEATFISLGNVKKSLIVTPNL